jgi:hypothetical protein
VHVIEFFFSLSCGVDVEVAESGLPEGWMRFGIEFTFVDFARYALLEFLDCGGGCFWLWFTYQEVDVVRHDYVSDKAKIHFGADEGKFLQKNVA